MCKMNVNEDAILSVTHHVLTDVLNKRDCWSLEVTWIETFKFQHKLLFKRSVWIIQSTCHEVLTLHSFSFECVFKSLMFLHILHSYNFLLYDNCWISFLSWSCCLLFSNTRRLSISRWIKILVHRRNLIGIFGSRRIQIFTNETASKILLTFFCFAFWQINPTSIQDSLEVEPLPN